MIALRPVEWLLLVLEGLRHTKWAPRRWRHRRALELAQAAEGAAASNDLRLAGELLESSLEWEDARESRLRLARLYSDAGDLARAERHYRLALARDYGDAEAILGLALTLHKRRRFDEALYLYLRVAEIDPANATALANVGGILFTMSRHEESLGYYRRAAEVKPAPRFAAKIGHILYTLGRSEEALRVLNAACDRSPGESEVLRLLGLIHELRQEPELAIECYEASLKSQPRDPATNQYLARALSNNHQHAEAVRYSLRAVEGQEDVKILAAIYWTLGWSQYSLGDLESSIQASRRALELDELYAVRLNLGLALLVRGLDAEAREQYLKGLAGVDTPSALKSFGLEDLEDAMAKGVVGPAAAEIKGLLEARLRELEGRLRDVEKQSDAAANRAR